MYAEPVDNTGLKILLKEVKHYTDKGAKSFLCEESSDMQSRQEGLKIITKPHVKARGFSEKPW